MSGGEAETFEVLVRFYVLTGMVSYFGVWFTITHIFSIFQIFKTEKKRRWSVLPVTKARMGFLLSLAHGSSFNN